MDLIRQCEAQFLVPAAVPGSSDIFRLFRPTSLQSTLHLNRYPTEPWLKTDMMNIRISSTDIARLPSLPAAQTVSTPGTAPVPSSVPSADVVAPAFKPLNILPENSATPAVELSGISCLFSAGGEVSWYMVETAF